jgi:Uma2 family endonuclease
MASQLLTAEELERLDIPDKRTELVRGRLIVREPAGYQHGIITARLTSRIDAHVAAHTLGVVLAAETGFKIASNPDTVRAPDVGFIRAERVPDPAPRGFAHLAPDLAVEVLSDGDRPGDVLAKISDWLRAGSRLVWVVDADRRVARVYRADGSVSLVASDETLDGEDVLPGFSCRLETVLGLTT